MGCLDYGSRPRICREFACDHGCDHCGDCDDNITLAMGGVIDSEDRRFMELHGVTVTQNVGSFTLVIPARCEWHVG